MPRVVTCSFLWTKVSILTITSRYIILVEKTWKNILVAISQCSKRIKIKILNFISVEK